VIASLAQHLMLDGRFEESATVAREARETAAAAGPEALEAFGHATCTLGVDIAYTGGLDDGLALLEEATAIARRAGRIDDLMRAYANRTTLLDLDSRRDQALAVVKEGIRDARAAGLADTYGAFLRGNAADILFTMGRWGECEVECRAGLSYRPAGVAWFSPTLYLGLVLVESRGDEEAARLVGQTLLQLEQVPAGQWTALVLRSAVSLLLWRGEAADAVAVAAREWDRVLETADAPQIAMAASTAMEAAAALAEAGRRDRDLTAIAAAGELASRVLRDAERHVSQSGLSSALGARREAELHLEMARAHIARSRGRSSPGRWARLATAWAAASVPYQQAKARWWQAQAMLEAGEGRPAASAPLLEAWRLARELPAGPLRAAVADVARRARITLPGASADDLAPVARSPLLPIRVRRGDAAWASSAAGHNGSSPGQHVVDGREAASLAERVGARSPSTDASFGLSSRELEVLALLTEGRTNREIAERLYISDRTVGVHVRHILAKLTATSRTQAAGKAIRLGLVPGQRPAHDPEVPATD
jgi:DNA-binding CsgD family transcriptional regulator